MGLKGKRILLTGASGFIGSHLAAKLRMRGAEVLTLIYEDGSSVDIRDWQSVKDLGSQFAKVDLTYHLAASMFIPHSFENPRETYEVNMLGTLNILELCRLHDVERVVFASSYVYGHPQYLPVDEKHPVNPTSPYARSKVIGEHLCKAYYEDYGMNCTILRPFNVYGERQNDKFLIPSILEQLAGGKIKLMDPEPRRDYLYISDAIEAYIKAGEYGKSGFEIINIGSGLSYSVHEIVSKILGEWGQEVRVSYQHLRRRGEIMDTVANIQKAKNVLDWEPKVDFTEGIRRYIEWYKAQQKLCI